MYLSRLDDTLAKSFPTAALPSLRMKGTFLYPGSIFAKS